jgi:hypothetical protein
MRSDMLACLIYRGDWARAASLVLKKLIRAAVRDPDVLPSSTLMRRG